MMYSLYETIEKHDDNDISDESSQLPEFTTIDYNECTYEKK